jgi:hypothetical protein
MSIEAMKQALEALEDLYAEQNAAPLWKRREHWENAMIKADVAIPNLRSAIEQAESAYQRGYIDGMAKGRQDTAIEQAEKQEPVCRYPRCSCNSKDWCDPARQQALDKMSENARELGLDYEPKEKK